MTHSLHRQGSIESLRNDYVMYARCSRGINMENSEAQVKRIVEIVFDEGPVNSGSSSHRSSIAAGTWDRGAALASQQDTHGFICCFDDREKMKRVLARLKDEDIGISVVVSGLIDEVMEMAREVGLQPHTINLSLGIRGKTELLPGPEVVQFTTMCGHALVATDLVKKAAHDVRSGRMSLNDAARMVGEPCICGIVNLTRVAQMLEDGK
jgi:hypothetical protein